jgi:polyketide cyclase/dehydrase/lipid transport protein
MANIEQHIDVNVPVNVAYDQWTQFESFPRFMEGVESVHQVDDTHLHWVATIAGKRQEWDAEISQQVPDQRVAWHATSGDRNAGAVDFHRLSDTSTRVTLTMDVQPSDAIEKVGTALGIAGASVKGDLERFKKFIEDRQAPTGAWRGEVTGGQVTSESGTTSQDRDRELAGTMGMTGSGDLGDRDFGTGTSGTSGGGMPDDPYGARGSSTVYDADRSPEDRDR